jgi:hypothetical protein
MKVIISTCDKYHKALYSLKYTLDKRGGSDLDVVVLGFKQPTFDLGKWNFYSLGVDTGPGNLSNDLWNFFKDFNDDYFLWLNDDIVLVDDLDLDLLREMESMMATNPDISKITVTSATKEHYTDFPVYLDKGDYQYREMPQTSGLRLSLNAALWRTSYFKKYCQQGVGNWAWENRGDAINDGATILGTIGRYVVDFGHIYRYGNNTISHNWYMSEYTDERLDYEDYLHLNEILKK